MKKTFLLLAAIAMTATSIQAQEAKQVPLLTVNGEGKIKVTPDQASITVSVESKGNKAADVKRDNDAKIDAVIKYIKKSGLDAKDYQTQRVYLNDEYDYEKKKHNYVATQTIKIMLKDLSKYDTLMEGLVDTGINNISGVDFQTSKLASYKSEARKAAVADAKAKAQDFTSALGQTVGKAYNVVDNSPIDYPRPMYETRMVKMASDALGANETLAVGEIEITANVSVSFLLN